MRGLEWTTIDTKKTKMRARRRRAQRIKMTGMCIATLIVFIFIGFLAISNLSKIKECNLRGR